MIMMTSWKAEQVTKIDAAERQIKEAIKLFFERRDQISIHTLAGAANQILYDISNESGMESMRNSLIIKDEYRKLWMDALNKEKTFSNMQIETQMLLLSLIQRRMYSLSQTLSVCMFD
jgi:hypothetical protein